MQGDVRLVYSSKSNKKAAKDTITNALAHLHLWPKLREETLYMPLSLQPQQYQNKNDDKMD